MKKIAEEILLTNEFPDEQTNIIRSIKRGVSADLRVAMKSGCPVDIYKLGTDKLIVSTSKEISMLKHPDGTVVDVLQVTKAK